MPWRGDPGNTTDPGGRAEAGLTGAATAADPKAGGTDAAAPPAAPTPQPDKPGLPWLVDLLDRAIKEVPYVRYAFGLVGVAAAAALVVIIFKFVGSEFSDDGSMLGMFVLSGFMVVFMFVLFLFAKIEDRNKQFLQLPAKIVAWLSVAIVIALVVVATQHRHRPVPAASRRNWCLSKPANASQKLLRDKFKSRQDYAQYCSDFDKEADHAYVELCINSSMKDFFQECSGFTPPAPEDEEQRVDDFACVEQLEPWRLERRQPGVRRCPRSPCRASARSADALITRRHSVPVQAATLQPAGTPSSAACSPPGKAARLARSKASTSAITTRTFRGTS